MGFIDWLFSRDNRKNVLVPIEPDVNNQIKALSQENSSLKAQLGRISANEKIKKEQINQEAEEQEVIEDLNKQNKEIQTNKFGQTVSLVKFCYEFIRNKKFRDNLELTDKDDKVVFGKLGDILTSETGELVITDRYGNPISHGKNLNNIIYKPETLGMQLKRGRILMPFDKEYNPAQDYTELEINDVTYDEEKQEFQETQLFRAKAHELLKQKIRIIRDLSAYIETLETKSVKSNNRIRDLERGIRLNKTQSETAQTELSLALTQSSQLLMRRDDMARQIAQLQSLKALYESKMNVLDSVVQKLLSRFEQANKTEYESIKEEVQADIEWAKNVVPEQITIEKKEEPQPLRLPNPGQNIGNAAIPSANGGNH